MYKCKRCGRVVETKHGLYGHYRFKHGIEYLTGEPVRETPYMKEISKRIKEIGQISEDKKAFEAWRRERMKAERLQHYKMWRQKRAQERRRGY